MKPHIRLRRGVWVCSYKVAGCGVPPLGHGWSAAQAYDEWAYLAKLQGLLA